jgi:hypothetical protein
MNIKSTTPMKRLTTHFKSMEHSLSAYGGRKTVLNKREAGGSTYNGDDRKAIESDFIVIFNFGQNKPSMSFVFEYLNPNLPNTFYAQIKAGEYNQTITTSAPMEFEAFRVALNKFNKFLSTPRKHEKASKKTVEKTHLEYLFEGFSALFFTETLKDSSKEHVDAYNTQVAEKLKELNIPSAEKKLTKAQSLHQTAVEEAKAQYQKIPEIEQIKKLEESLRIAKKKAQLKLEKIEQDLKVEEKRLEERKANSDLHGKKTDLQIFKSKLVSSLPPMVRALLRSHTEE